MQIRRHARLIYQQIKQHFIHFGRIDGGQPKVYPFSFCSNIGCFSRIGVTDEELGLFRAGSSAQITIVPAAAPDETVDLSLSLSGFTAGYNALLAATEAPAAAE